LTKLTYNKLINRLNVKKLILNKTEKDHLSYTSNKENYFAFAD